jgi:LDH2 family malate/lactate/ureidoglycolate dehydrogenase
MHNATEDARYQAEDLIELAFKLLVRTGLPEEKARVVAETLTEADLMGHSTHGLQLLSPYLADLEKGDMTADGEPEVIRDRGAAVTWDGHFLPGPWVTHKAIDLALERIKEHPVVTIVIKRSHHIACLAAYPERATKEGLMMLLSCSDPRGATIAPFGAVSAVYTPNPLAAGIPTESEPIIFDISMSTTANGLVMRSHKEGKLLEHAWLLDSQGNATNDPEAFYTDPPATILPLGGLDAGYKGYALGLLVESLTSNLGGNGRSKKPEKWGASVFLQVIDPDAFGGKTAFLHENEHLAQLCLNARTKPGGPPVRLPGSRALQLRSEQLRLGVKLYPTIPRSVSKWTEKYGLAFPAPVATSEA